MDMVELKTSRLLLSSFTPDDAPFVLKMVNDPGWIRNIGERNVRSVDAARDYIVQRFMPGLWLLGRTATGEPIGVCGLVEQRPGLDFPDLGYAVVEHASGNGYATEMARALLDFVQTVRGIGTVAGITAPDNLASQRVLIKLGFAYVGKIDLPKASGASAYFLVHAAKA